MKKTLCSICIICLFSFLLVSCKNRGEDTKETTPTPTNLVDLSVTNQVTLKPTNTPVPTKKVQKIVPLATYEEYFTGICVGNERCIDMETELTSIDEYPEVTELERKLFYGDVVLLPSGTSLYLDGDRQRETLIFEKRNHRSDETKKEWCLSIEGAEVYFEEGSITGNVYAAQLNGTKDGSSRFLLVESKDNQGCHYQVYAFCQFLSFCELQYVGYVSGNDINDIQIEVDGFTARADGENTKHWTICRDELYDEAMGSVWFLEEVPFGCRSLTELIEVFDEVVLYDTQASEEPSRIVTNGCYIAINGYDSYGYISVSVIGDVKGFLKYKYVGDTMYLETPSGWCKSSFRLK